MKSSKSILIILIALVAAALPGELAAQQTTLARTARSRLLK